MRCQYCNSEIPDNYSFCPNCGKSLNPEPSQTANGSGRKFCDNCGAPLEAGKPFCANCGKPVGENMQQNNPNSGMPPYPGSPVSQPVGKKKKTGLIVAIVIICLVLLAGGIGTAMYFLVFDDKDDKKKQRKLPYHRTRMIMTRRILLTRMNRKTTPCLTMETHTRTTLDQTRSATVNSGIWTLL